MSEAEELVGSVVDVDGRDWDVRRVAEWNDLWVVLGRDDGRDYEMCRPAAVVRAALSRAREAADG